MDVLIEGVDDVQAFEVLVGDQWAGKLDIRRYCPQSVSDADAADLVDRFDASGRLVAASWRLGLLSHSGETAACDEPAPDPSAAFPAGLGLRR